MVAAGRRTPLVSVLITSHQHAKFVTQAICSVLDQTFDDFELIVIDDGSTDGSPELIRDYLARRRSSVPVRLVLRDRRGRMTTLNEGLHLATGTYFTPLVSDDTWAPERLERHVAALEEAEPHVAACYSDCWVIDAEGTRSGSLSMWTPFRGGDIYRDLVEHRYVPPTPTSTFRRSAILEVGGYDERLRFLDDWDLWLKLARVYRTVYLAEPLGGYRIHGGNATLHDVEDVRDDARDTFEELIARDPELPVDRREVQAHLDAWYAAHLYNLLMLPQARRAALAALRGSASNRLAWTVLLRSMLGTRFVRWVRDRRREARGLGAAG